MKQLVPLFLEQKSLSQNSKSAYAYDLEQFLDVTEGQIGETKLKLYQASIAKLKPSAQKRKLSIINQFLYFLYETGEISDYHRLELPKIKEVSRKIEPRDVSRLRTVASDQVGSLVTLLILDLGLLPSEILAIRVADISLEFKILTLTKSGQRRILELSDSLLAKLPPFLSGTYLFDHHGKPYTRQWLFKQLEQFLTQIGESEWTAQKLREQYILEQIHQGMDLHQLAKQLGLKSILSLEKYK